MKGQKRVSQFMNLFMPNKQLYLNSLDQIISSLKGARYVLLLPGFLYLMQTV